jgi:hypothetical protein
MFLIRKIFHNVRNTTNSILRSVSVSEHDVDIRGGGLLFSIIRNALRHNLYAPRPQILTSLAGGGLLRMDGGGSGFVSGCVSVTAAMPLMPVWSVRKKYIDVIAKPIMPEAI